EARGRPVRPAICDRRRQRRARRAHQVAQGAGPLAVALLLLAGCATQPAEQGISIPLTVSKPDGAGPFPAIVILHDCSGLGPRSSGAPARWAKTLVEHGYVVVIPDSFSTRGAPDGV